MPISHWPATVSSPRSLWRSPGSECDTGAINHDEFIAAVLANPVNRTILAQLSSLDLPDAWLVSGALFQTVWNLKTGQPPEHGIRDYDLFYFDPDTTYEAEDRVIKRAAAAFADLGAIVELRNQARVHLWYEGKFGVPYPPLVRATDGIDRFLMHNAQVGVRPCGTLYEIYAPRGLSDIDQMIVRPNETANFHAERYREKAERWKALWPPLSILEP